VIDELEQLSLAVGAVSRADAAQVVDAVNRRLLDLVRAQVIKLYWSEEAQDGNILQPLAFINNTRHPDPMPFQVPATPNGVLAWVFREARPVWFAELRNSAMGDKVLNLATSEDIPSRYLDIQNSPDLDAIMVVPIMVRGTAHGVYSLEAHSSERFNERILKLLQQVTNAFSPLLWNADVYAYDLAKTSRAVSKFLNLTRGFAFDPVWLEQDVRSGFIARPFGQVFARVETLLSELLASKGVRARHYEPIEGRGLIIDEIMRQIRNSHFCICDITSINANVMTEVGMVMILGKPMMLIRDRNDTAPIPFDLGHRPVYSYEVLGSGRGELRVLNPAEGRYQPFSAVLDDFIAQLPTETGFFSANSYAP
jgi:hypothetical protein